MTKMLQLHKNVKVVLTRSLFEVNKTNAFWWHLLIWSAPEVVGRVTFWSAWLIHTLSWNSKLISSILLKRTACTVT